MTRAGKLSALMVTFGAIAAIGAAPRAHAYTTTTRRPVEVRALGTVTALSVVTATGRPSVVVTVNGENRVLDFTLAIRIHRARATTRARGTAALLHKRSRGGIDGRLAPYKDNVLRVVSTVTCPQVRAGRVTSAVRSCSRVTHDSIPALGTLRRHRKPCSARRRSVCVRLHCGVRRTIENTVLARHQSQQARITVTSRQAFARCWRRSPSSPTARSSSKRTLGTSLLKSRPARAVALRSILASQGLALFVDESGILTVDTNANLLRSGHGALVTAARPHQLGAAGSLVGDSRLWRRNAVCGRRGASRRTVDAGA